MRRHNCLTLLVFVSLTGFTTTITSLHAQGPAQATPEHEALAEEAGVWDAKTKMWMAPDAEPMAGKAVETNKMLGDLWLVSEFQGEMMGMKFTGHGQYGYDPTTKKYVGTWVDTMSPYLSVMEGTMEDGKLTMMSRGRDMQTGKETTTKMVSTYPDKDHKTFTMYAPVEGKADAWWKMFEVQYTRR